jgi:hypothetical protein
MVWIPKLVTEKAVSWNGAGGDPYWLNPIRLEVNAKRQLISLRSTTCAFPFLETASAVGPMACHVHQF